TLSQRERGFLRGGPLVHEVDAISLSPSFASIHPCRLSAQDQEREIAGGTLRYIPGPALTGGLQTSGLPRLSRCFPPTTNDRASSAPRVTNHQLTFPHGPAAHESPAPVSGVRTRHRIGRCRGDRRLA